MSLHDQIMGYAAADMLVEQLGEPGALVIEGLRHASAGPVTLSAILTPEVTVQRFDTQRAETVEEITRQAHVQLAELEREKIADIPSRLEVTVGDLKYASTTGPRSGVFLTIGLTRTELVRNFTGEGTNGPV
jgi:hypothetical protein